MRINLFVLTLFAASTTALAGELVPFAPGSQTLAVKPECSFADKKLPANTIVLAAGSYGGRSSNFQIDQSGHQATQFDVAVHADKPVALLLSAYEPTIWNIGWTKNTKIVAVYATGYHRQAVSGLPKEVPIITSSFTEKGACGYNVISGDLTWVNPKSREVFGKEVTRVYNRAAAGVLDIVETPSSKTEYVTSKDTPPQSFIDKNAPLAGTAGLEAAVKKGLIRPMTAADIEEVRKVFIAKAANSAPLKKLDVPPVAGASPATAPAVPTPSLSAYRGYVVLKQFEYPAGLFGGNMAHFIIPKGVPVPKGNPGHSVVVDLNTATCLGPIGCR